MGSPQGRRELYISRDGGRVIAREEFSYRNIVLYVDGLRRT